MTLRPEEAADGRTAGGRPESGRREVSAWPRTALPPCGPSPPASPPSQRTSHFQERQLPWEHTSNYSTCRKSPISQLGWNVPSARQQWPLGFLLTHAQVPEGGAAGAGTQASDPGLGPRPPAGSSPAQSPLTHRGRAPPCLQFTGMSEPPGAALGAQGTTGLRPLASTPERPL